MTKVEIVVIYVWKEMAYVPVQDQFESGIFLGVEPVYTASLTIDDLSRVVREVKSIGHKIVPDPKTREEYKSRKDPVLVATGTRSWKKIARTGYSYTICWTDKQVRIDMSRLDKQDRWEYDPNKITILPSDASLEEILQIIMNDINERKKQDNKRIV
jgi:hypothetical protein